MSAYKIRPYVRGDQEEFLSLYQAVFGSDRSEHWFRWKYEENPHVDHVPILVATDGEQIVGARSFFALEIACCGVPQVVLQPCDAMVHPDHRRQGLFTRMTEQAIDRYSDDCSFFFNFPNEQSLPGNLKLGWQVVSHRASYLRIENPTQWLSSRMPIRPLQWASKPMTPLAKRYYRFKKRKIPASDLTVKKEQSIPVDALATLYNKNVPDEIHAARTEQSYEWRLKNPDYEYTAYIATGADGPIAAAITGRSARSNATTLRLLDVVPLGAAPESAQIALLRRIITDCEEVDMFSAPAQGFNDKILRAFGFFRDDELPLSLLTTQTTHVVRTLTGEWTQAGRDITDTENWLLTFFVYDVF